MDDAHSRIRRQLEVQLDRLTRRVGRIEDDLRISHDRDWTERAIEVENDPVLERLDASGRFELAAIRLALARLDEGTYGACSKCGKPIDERRLQALPTATTCLVCAV
jgi:RNA polymerase-binding transcription factor DksA